MNHTNEIFVILQHVTVTYPEWSFDVRHVQH